MHRKVSRQLYLQGHHRALWSVSMGGGGGGGSRGVPQGENRIFRPTGHVLVLYTTTGTLGGPSWAKSGTTMVVPDVPCVPPLNCGM